MIPVCFHSVSSLYYNEQNIYYVSIWEDFFFQIKYINF